MTTIRDELAEYMGEGYSTAYVDEQAGTIALHVLEFFGIDPDWPKGSIVVTQRPKCPRCEGIGKVYFDDDDDLGDLCPTCKGTGYVPDEWATVDRCLTWLRERHGLDLGDITPVWLNGGASPLRSGYAVVIFGPEDSDEFCGEADTAHAALIAACIAVSESAA